MILIVIGALIVLLQLMATIAWWRRGSKYGRLEVARREQMTRGELATLSKPYPRPTTTQFMDWDVQADFDDPPYTETPK